jgi:hypothetical protein
MENGKKPGAGAILPLAHPAKPAEPADRVAAQLLHQQVPIAHQLGYHARLNPQHPKCVQIHRGDGAMATRISGEMAMAIYENARALRLSHGQAIESTFCVGVLCGLMAPRPQVVGE